MVTVRIWDLPTRLFHWALACAVVGLGITGLVGGNVMVWHFRFGYAVFTLLVFRLFWGLLGGRWSRWSTLPLGFRPFTSYLQGRSTPEQLAGHNPLGSLSVLAMLFFLSLQVATGLVSDDEISNSGPFSSLVSSTLVTWATSWHKHWGKLTLIFLVSIHLSAIAWYHWRQHQLLLPAMWHGYKNLEVPVDASRDDLPSRVMAALIFTLSVAVVFYLVSLGA
ncbi:cytochrome B [Limnohabitans sp. T6-5]|nr:cytochrome B [Limnohabitans sp. T6-5]